MDMIVGEVCLLTGDVNRLADFYKALLRVDNGSRDAIHQTILAQETMLTILKTDAAQDRGAARICLAFTVENIEEEYARLLAMGAEILQKPTRQPWGAVNLCFADPDGNPTYLRAFSAPRNE